MTRDAPSQLAAVPPGSPPGSGRRLQFSLSALLLAIMAAAVGCAAVRWLGYVWLLPLALAGLSAAALWAALCRRSAWNVLRPGYWHVAIWLALGAAASGLAVNGCLYYNTIAGTDKTPPHIVRISAAALAGPLVGPVANPAAGEAPLARRWAALLFAILCLAFLPFLLVRRTVPWAIALACWLGYVAASVLWFFGAMISLMFFLS